VSEIRAPKAQYQQIADLLRARIDDGTYASGSALPSEPALADELGVSRVTVNRALAVLRGTGHVRVRRGAGTFVRNLPLITRDARERYRRRGEGTGAGDVEARSMGLRPRTQYLQIGRVDAAPRVADALGLEEGAPVLIRRRRLYANDEPIQLADSYYPWDLVAGTALLNEDTGVGGSYARLAELGHGPVRFVEDVSVAAATDDEVAALDLDGALPVFRIAHLAWSADDRPIEVRYDVMPGHQWVLRYDWQDELPAGEAGADG
jgi:GntR family transcriptional regulator